MQDAVQSVVLRVTQACRPVLLDVGLAFDHHDHVGHIGSCDDVLRVADAALADFETFVSAVRIAATADCCFSTRIASSSS